MPEPVFHFVSAPDALIGAPTGWAAEMLHDGEVALLPGDALADVDRVAHELGQPAILVLRREETAQAQDEVVRSYSANLPLIWVAPSFTDAAEAWARDRGAMSLLVTADQPLSEDQRRTIDRFVASLGRQSE